MNVFTPEALKRSNFKPCRLDEVRSKEHDGVYYFVFPSPNPINEINGDGDLIEIDGWAGNYSEIWHERGVINATPETIVYYKQIKDEIMNGSKPEADLALARDLGVTLSPEQDEVTPPVVLGNRGYETDAAGKPVDIPSPAQRTEQVYRELTDLDRVHFRMGVNHAAGVLLAAGKLEEARMISAEWARLKNLK